MIIFADKISYKKYSLKFKHEWRISRGSLEQKKIIVIEISSDKITGYGESAPSSHYNENVDTSLNFFKKAESIIFESNLLNYRELIDRVSNIAPGEFSAKAAIDMAILDLISKKLQIPLYSFLGINKKNTPLTSFSIGIDSLDMIEKKIKEAEKFPILKIKVGHAEDEKMIKFIRKITDKPLYVDANEGWINPDIAINKINWLQKMGVLLVEQPMPANLIDEMIYVKEKTTLPLIADENITTTADIFKAKDGFHGINIKLMKCGGITEAIKMITIAKFFNLRTMIGCMIESSLAISAAAQISPLIDYADLDGNLLISNDPYKNGVKVTDGKLILSDNIGIGVNEKST
jgi:L-Ala-D/L-Glu epimerase / N-acetyl-D-glutamate racemase